MADETSNLKKGRSSISDNELRSPDEKRSRDKSLKLDLTLSSGDMISKHMEMAHDDIGKKMDLILSSLEAMNSKLESISAVVKNLEKSLNKVQSRVEKLERRRSPSMKCMMASKL